MVQKLVLLVLLPCLALCQDDANKMRLSFEERQKETHMVIGEETAIIVEVKRPAGLINNETLKLNVSVVMDLPDIVNLGTSSTCQITLAHGSSFPLKIQGKNAGVVGILVQITSAGKDFSIV